MEIEFKTKKSFLNLIKCEIEKTSTITLTIGDAFVEFRVFYNGKRRTTRLNNSEEVKIRNNIFEYKSYKGNEQFMINDK